MSIGEHDEFILIHHAWHPMKSWGKAHTVVTGVGRFYPYAFFEWNWQIEWEMLWFDVFQTRSKVNPAIFTGIWTLVSCVPSNSPKKSWRLLQGRQVRITVFPHRPPWYTPLIMLTIQNSSWSMFGDTYGVFWVKIRGSSMFHASYQYECGRTERGINLIPFLGEWTSTYQLFWCSPGVQGFDTLPNHQKGQFGTDTIWHLCFVRMRSHGGSWASAAWRLVGSCVWQWSKSSLWYTCSCRHL